MTERWQGREKLDEYTHLYGGINKTNRARDGFPIFINNRHEGVGCI